MAITKNREVQHVTVMPSGKLVEYSITTIMEDGVQISQFGSQIEVEAGDDLTIQGPLVREIGQQVHTTQRKDARAARDEARQNLV